MNVAANCDWGVNLLDVGLFNEDVFCLIAQVSHFALFDVFAAFELLDLLVQVVHNN